MPESQSQISPPPAHHFDWRLGPLHVPVHLPAVASESGGLSLQCDDALALAADRSHWHASRREGVWHWQTAATVGQWQVDPTQANCGAGKARVATGAWRTAVLEAAIAAMWCEVVERNGLVLHAATLASPAGDGRSVVVAGRSGAGKSTLAQRFPDLWVNEEHAFLLPTPMGWQAWYLRQYRGQRNHASQWGALQALYLLDPSDRGRTHRVRLTERDAQAGVLANGYIPHGDGLAALLANSQVLVQAVPVYRLGHSLATSAADLAALLFASKDSPDA